MQSKQQKPKDYMFGLDLNYLNMKIKTNKEHLIDIRNMVSRRIVEAKVNISYFYEVAKKAKKVSQEIVDARNSIALNESNIKKDMIFLRCIDLVLKGEK